MLPWRGFLLRPTAAPKMVRMRRPSANTENSRRTREKPLVPRACKCVRGIKNLQQPFERWDMRAPIHYWRALTHDVAFCSQIFDIKGSLLRRERALILMGAYLKLHAYFVSFFQSSPNLTKSLIFHWQCEATIIVKSVGKATSLSTSFLSFSLSWPNVELCAQFFSLLYHKIE